ncbi:MAG: hypothetical protein ACTSSP_06825 [Candidatus Asgardarchaeia archaeon]
MIEFKKCEGIEKGKDIIVIGSGSSIKKYKDEILNLIIEKNIKTIGINYMSSLCTPDYHLWTNKQRYRDLGQCVDKKSSFLFGIGMPEKLIKRHYDGDYYVVDYTFRLLKARKESIGYKDGKISGHFRTAGALAIMLAHLMGAENIYVVGMDGFTLHPKGQLDKEEENHHCYGDGYTDDATWKECLEKDRLVDECLFSLWEYGIDFKIITPTKFDSFYVNGILKEVK